MNIAQRRLGAALALLLITVAFTAAAHAREGFFIGGSVARQEVTGDLDGTKGFISDSQTALLLAGKLNPGLGLGVIVGYGFSPYIGVEFSWINTSHIAEHDAVNFRSESHLTTRLLAVRGTLPIYDVDLYAKVGYGSYTVDYTSFTLMGDVDVNNDFVFTEKRSLLFGGNGTGVGVGAEYALGNLGLGAGLTYHSATLDVGHGGGENGVLPKSLSIQIMTVDLTATYHF